MWSRCGLKVRDPQAFAVLPVPLQAPDKLTAFLSTMVLGKNKIDDDEDDEDDGRQKTSQSLLDPSTHSSIHQSHKSDKNLCCSVFCRISCGITADTFDRCSPWEGDDAFPHEGEEPLQDAQE